MAKLRANDGRIANRPKDVELSELEFAQRKLRNKAVKAYNEVVPKGTTVNVPQTPSFNKLKNDWRFWVRCSLFLSNAAPVVTLPSPACLLLWQVALIAVVSLLPGFFSLLAGPEPTEYLVWAPAAGGLVA